MTSRLSFRWFLTLLALVAPAALGQTRNTGAADAQQQAASDVVFRHYL